MDQCTQACNINKKLLIGAAIWYYYPNDGG